LLGIFCALQALDYYWNIVHCSASILRLGVILN
jgi:hypothetical protein